MKKNGKNKAKKGRRWKLMERGGKTARRDPEKGRKTEKKKEKVPLAKQLQICYNLKSAHPCAAESSAKSP